MTKGEELEVTGKRREGQQIEEQAPEQSHVE